MSTDEARSSRTSLRECLTRSESVFKTSEYSESSTVIRDQSRLSECHPRTDRHGEDALRPQQALGRLELLAVPSSAVARGAERMRDGRRTALPWAPKRTDRCRCRAG